MNTTPPPEPAPAFPPSTVALLVADTLGTQPLDEAADAARSPVVNDLGGSMVALIDAYHVHARAPSTATMGRVLDGMGEVNKQRGLAGVKEIG